MLDTVIFDNSVFGYFVDIKKVDLEIIIRSFIRKVLIPFHVVPEMEKLALCKEKTGVYKIKKCINQAYSQQFYCYCKVYDKIIFECLRTNKLDSGEAGAIAQAREQQVSFFISDDIKNLAFIKENYSHIKQYSTFFLIALADISNLLSNYEDVLIEFALLRDYHNFSTKNLNQCCETSIRQLWS